MILNRKIPAALAVALRPHQAAHVAAAVVVAVTKTQVERTARVVLSPVAMTTNQLVNKPPVQFKLSSGYNGKSVHGDED